jgi:hypothetical protein
MCKKYPKGYADGEGEVSDLLSPWKVTAESAMYTDADDYCYTYE